MNRAPEPPSDPMRGIVLGLTIFFAFAALAARMATGHLGTQSASIALVMSIGMTRLALVLAALWLAWPTIRRPAMWFPPGIAAVALIALGACVIQPRLAIAIIPAIGALLAFSAFVRMTRGS